MRGLPRLGHDRGRRGATLLVTVLVATVAASIVVVMVQLALFSLSSDVRASAYESADGQLQSMRQDVATVLAQDPLVVYVRVLEWELPRVCLPRSLRAEPESVVLPGQQWPQECGYTWGYAPREEGSDLLGSGVLLSPPGPGRPYFASLGVARSGEVLLAVRDYYALGGQARPRAYSSAALALSALRSSTINVPVYSYESVDVDLQDLGNGALVASEKSLTIGSVFDAPSSIAQGALLAAGVASSGPPPVLAVRDVYPQPMPLGLLRSSFSALGGVACPSTSVSDPPVNGSPSWSSSLCLRPGSVVTPLTISDNQWQGTAADVPVEVPSDAAAFLLLPASDPPGAIRVLYSTEGSPAILSSESASESFWTELGVFFVPASGLIYSSKTTYVGLCGAAFTTDPCASWGSGLSASVFDVPFSIVAGSPAEPADMVIAGPVRASSLGRIGALASGSVIVPFFVAPSASTAVVDLDLAVLGAGVESPLLRSEPASPASSRGPVEFTGLRLGRNLSALPGVFSSFSWTFPQSLDGSAPWLPSPELRFERVRSERLSPAAAELALTGRPGPS